MEVLIILLIASISISGGFLIAFIWNVKNGQFDDTYSPAQKILMDDITYQNDNKNNPIT
jgi:cbb3-type cytochrome oxidase maturation protein